MTEQEKEINTIRGRTITLNLSDADVERLFMKTGEVGLSVPKLFENFIGDLVDGTYSNGSDERMYANQWFDRCGFSFMSEMTFVEYLLLYSDINDTLSIWDDITELKETINNPEELATFDSEDIYQMKEEFTNYEQELNEIFADYKSHGGTAECLEAAIQEVLNWKKEKDRMLNEALSNYRQQEQIVKALENKVGAD